MGHFSEFSTNLSFRAPPCASDDPHVRLRACVRRRDDDVSPSCGWISCRSGRDVWPICCGLPCACRPSCDRMIRGNLLRPHRNFKN